MVAAFTKYQLAVAVAISLLGLNSGAALATVVGVLVEVPVTLSLIAYANLNWERLSKKSRSEFRQSQIQFNEKWGS